MHLFIKLGQVSEVNFGMFIYSALTLEDDVRGLSSLIISFIRTVSFGRDFEQQLKFYVECRSAFCNTDLVLTFLIQVSNILYV